MEVTYLGDLQFLEDYFLSKEGTKYNIFSHCKLVTIGIQYLASEFRTYQ